MLIPHIIQKAMSVSQLRFQKDCHSQEDTVHLLDFIFEEVDSAAFNQGTAWSGQVNSYLAPSIA